MRRSHQTNTLVLFSDQTGSNVYKDKWLNGILQYTGMGLKGIKYWIRIKIKF